MSLAFIKRLAALCLVNISNKFVSTNSSDF